MARKATKNWILEGRPRNEDNDIFRAKKEAKLELRKAIKNNEIERSIKENNFFVKHFIISLIYCTCDYFPT